VLCSFSSRNVMWPYFKIGHDILFYLSTSWPTFPVPCWI
jgi:hypothetical protein